jgi:hypothetical protein
MLLVLLMACTLFSVLVEGYVPTWAESGQAMECSTEAHRRDVWHTCDYGLAQDYINTTRVHLLCGAWPEGEGEVEGVRHANTSWLECFEDFRWCRGQNIHIRSNHGGARAAPNEPFYKLPTMSGDCWWDQRAYEALADSQAPGAYGPHMKDTSKNQRTLATYGTELAAWDSGVVGEPFHAQACAAVLDKGFALKYHMLNNLKEHMDDFMAMHVSELVAGWEAEEYSLLKFFAFSDGSGSPAFTVDHFKVMERVFTSRPLVKLSDYFQQTVCVDELFMQVNSRLPFLGVGNSACVHCTGNQMYTDLKERVYTRLVEQKQPQTLQQRAEAAETDGMQQHAASLSEQCKGKALCHMRLRVTVLSRQRAWRSDRQIINFEEVVEYLRAFVHVQGDQVWTLDVREAHFDSSVVSFEEQMAVMRETDVLLGMHGAGLAHIYFMPRRGALLEIYNCGDRAYSHLARKLGLGYLTWPNTELAMSLLTSGRVPSRHLTQDRAYPNQRSMKNVKFYNYRVNLSVLHELVEEAAAHVISRSCAGEEPGTQTERVHTPAMLPAAEESMSEGQLQKKKDDLAALLVPFRPLREEL